MNETVLALMSAIAIYGLSSLALPRPATDSRDDPSDVQSEEVSDVTPAPAPDDPSAESSSRRA